MKIEVFEAESNPFEGLPTTIYQYQNKNADAVSIGAISLKNDEALALAFNIEPEMQGKGIGRTAFQMGLKKYSATADIKYVIGKWKVDLDYVNLENCASTNLTIFNSFLQNGLKAEEAALQTPTGKWVFPFGFKYVKILRLEPKWVEVEFYKELPDLKIEKNDEDFDLSYLDL